MVNWHWFKFGIINFVIVFGIQLALVAPFACDLPLYQQNDWNIRLQDTLFFL
jgi:hypothetical protein